MLNLFLMSQFILLIVFFVMLIASSLAKKIVNEREKNSPFECGFDPLNSSRIPFSIQFFLISIIFLIFDVEITLILPMIIIMKTSNVMYWTVTCMIFIFILLIGLYHEWNQGMLNWTK